MSIERDTTLRDYLSLLAGGESSGQFFDIRWRLANGLMRKRSVPATDQLGAARLIARQSQQTDVYVGVALRDRAGNGGKAAISGSHLLYIESDDPQTIERLARFPHPPTLEIRSGTPDHLHLYWQLNEPATPAQAESANRRLAQVLAGDPSCVDIARVLRPPATFNYKHRPPRPVVVRARREQAICTLTAITGDLPEEKHSPTTQSDSTPTRQNKDELDTHLLAVPAADYVRVLAERSPDRSGKVLCPFHEERTPSLQLYPDGTFYCFGNGCGRGGTIFDFAAHLWSITPRGRGFIELRERLQEQLRPEGARCPRREDMRGAGDASTSWL